MEIGNKILELRKKKNLSQEELAEAIGVTRQTISKWELGETSPDIKQALNLANLFQISVDELVGNKVEEKVIEKVSNTERLAGIILKGLKILGIFFLGLLVIDIISLGLFVTLRRSNSETEITETVDMEMECSLEGNDYVIRVSSEGEFNCRNCDLELEKELKDNYIDVNDIMKTEENIRKYFIKKNGGCE